MNKNFDRKIMEMRKQTVVFSFNHLTQYGYIQIDELDDYDGFMIAYDELVNYAGLCGAFSGYGEEWISDDDDDEIRRFMWGLLEHYQQGKINFIRVEYWQ